MTHIYSTRAIDIERVLLVQYPHGLDLRTLSKESNVSLGQTYNVSKALIRERLAIRDSLRSKLKLMAPLDLLKKLAVFNNFLGTTQFIEYYTQEEDINKFLEKLKRIDEPDYAITGLTGAMLVAPLVRPTNIHMYVKKAEDIEILANQLNLELVEENGNIKFAIAKSSGIFYGVKKINDIKVISEVQLYIDLFNYPARGYEAASEVYKIIENKWKPFEG